MEPIELVAHHRQVAKRSAKRLRSQGVVPGVMYGYDVGSVPLQFEALNLARILNEAGASQLIYLRIGEEGVSQPVLAREIQRDIFTGEPVHVDFLAVSMTEKITAEVVINLVGEPAPVMQGEGILLQGINSLEIECLPGDLIPSLEVNISDLDFDVSIFVSDLDLPEGITVLSDPQEMVAQVTYEQLEIEEEVEEEEEGLFVEESAQVEVIGKGKEAEEEELEEA